MVIKTKYLVMSRDQNAGQSQNVKTDNSSFDRVEQFKYLGTALRNQNYIQEEIKSRLRPWDVVYCSLLAKNIKIKIHRAIILPLVLYGCETWSIAVFFLCLRFSTV